MSLIVVRILFVFALAEGRAFAETPSPSELWKKSSDTGALRDLVGTQDMCSLVAQKSLELKNVDEKILNQKAVQAQAKAIYDNVKQTSPEKQAALKESRNNLLKDNPEFRQVDVKYSSNFEMDSEKKAFLEDLKKEIGIFGELIRMFETESTVGWYDCPKIANGNSRNECETEKRKLFGKLKSVFLKRVNMAKRMKWCVESVKILGACKPDDVKCPLMAGEYSGEIGRSVFNVLVSRGFGKDFLSSGVDICAQARESYAKRISEYKIAKLGLDSPKTGREIKARAELAKIDTQISNLDALLATSKRQVDSAENRMRELASEYKQVERELDAAKQECSDEKCRPLAKFQDTNEFLIDTSPKIPIIHASASPSNGEWTFQTSWSYNRLFCDYPQSVGQKVNGGVFSSDRYKDSVYGGDLTLQYETSCSKGMASTVLRGKIVGSNPEKPDVYSEIDFQVKNQITKQNGTSTRPDSNLIKEADAEVLKKIVCRESEYNQFWPKGKKEKTGMPYACNERDIGLFQVKSVPNIHEHCLAAWNWRYNVQKGVELYVSKKRDTLGHHRSELDPKYGNNEGLVSCISNGIVDMLKKGLENSATSSKVISDAYVLMVANKISAKIRDKQNITISDFSEFTKVLGKEVVSNMLSSLAEYKVLPPRLDEAQQVSEAIRRYNGGREYKYLPSDATCKGTWVENHTASKNKTYVFDVLNMDLGTCKVVKPKGAIKGKN